MWQLEQDYPCWIDASRCFERLKLCMKDGRWQRRFKNGQDLTAKIGELRDGVLEAAHEGTPVLLRCLDVARALDSLVVLRSCMRVCNNLWRRWNTLLKRQTRASSSIVVVRPLTQIFHLSFFSFFPITSGSTWQLSIGTTTIHIQCTVPCTWFVKTFPSENQCIEDSVHWSIFVHGCG